MTFRQYTNLVTFSSYICYTFAIIDAIKTLYLCYTCVASVPQNNEGLIYTLTTAHPYRGRPTLEDDERFRHGLVCVLQEKLFITVLLCPLCLVYITVLLSLFCQLLHKKCIGLDFAHCKLFNCLTRLYLSIKTTFVVLLQMW